MVTRFSPSFNFLFPGLTVAGKPAFLLPIPLPPVASNSSAGVTANPAASHSAQPGFVRAPPETYPCEASPFELEPMCFLRRLASLLLPGHPEDPGRPDLGTAPSTECGVPRISRPAHHDDRATTRIRSSDSLAVQLSRIFYQGTVAWPCPFYPPRSLTYTQAQPNRSFHNSNPGARMPSLAFQKS